MCNEVEVGGSNGGNVPLRDCGAELHWKLEVMPNVRVLTCIAELTHSQLQ